MLKYIGGAPRSGKTTLAKDIAKDNDMCLHLDDFRMKVYQSLSEQEKENFFPILVHIKNFPKYNKKIFSLLHTHGLDIEIAKRFGFKDALEHYIQVYGVDSYLQDELIHQKLVTEKALSENVGDCIVEGVSLSPTVIRELIDRGEINESEVVFLVKSQKEAIEAVLEQDPGSFVYRDMNKMSDVILRYGEAIENLAVKNNLRVIDTAYTDVLSL